MLKSWQKLIHTGFKSSAVYVRGFSNDISQETGKNVIKELTILKGSNSFAVEDVFEVFIRHLHAVDESYKDAIKSFGQSNEFHKATIASFGQRSVLEGFFRLIISEIKDDQTFFIDVRSAVKTHFASSLPHGTKPKSQQDVDHDHSVEGQTHNLMTSVCSKNPRMSEIITLATIPGVDKLLRSRLNYSVSVPDFTDQLSLGVLSEPVHDIESFLSICVNEKDPNMAFFRELARIFKKPVETFDIEQAFHGGRAQRAKLAYNA